LVVQVPIKKSSFIKGFTITPAETADLIAFLQSLTDEDFITNPAYSDPNLPTMK
jgi:cytochrome c peroxidase